MKILLLLITLAASSAIAAVESQDISVRDEKRGKNIECRVYFPAKGDKLPLIVFSHGFGGDKTAFGVISESIADNGYVVVHPSHTDKVGGPRNLPGRGRLGALRSGGGLVGLLADPERIESRIADIVTVIDSTEQICVKIPALKGRIDRTCIGVGGHSYGAYTSMLLGGVTADIGGAKARSFAEERVRCILPISGQGTGQQGLTGSSWARLNLPMMTITGSGDRGAEGQGPEWKKEPFRLSPPGEKYLVFIEGANHFSFGGRLGGKSSNTTEIVKATSLAFWDAYLKNDEAARAELKSGNIIKRFQGSTIESK